jgi:hypothetical protein
MPEKWYIASNRWVQMSEGEAKCHVIWITSTPKPIHKPVVNLDFGYGRKGLDEEIAERIVRSVNCYDDLLASLQVILDCVNYDAGACRVNEMVGAVLPQEVIIQAVKAIAKTKEEVCLKK